MSEQPRRLSPEDRRVQLLDIAKQIVEHDGVAACSVELVAQRAGVTPQLVHKYFGTRASLFEELFRREDDNYQAEMQDRLDQAESFEDVVRVFVTANFDQLSHATAMGQLRVLPDITGARDERRRKGGRSAERVLVQALTAEYPASPEVTEFVLRLGSAASIEAGNLAAQNPRRNRDDDIDNAVRFILAGIRELVS